MTDLTGGYTLVSGERDGHPIPHDHVSDTVVRFTADTVTVTHKDRGDSYAATYKLDETTTPWGVTMTSTTKGYEGAVAKGLIERAGDTVKLIYALPGKPAPTGFSTKAGELLFVMTNFNK
jgi:uncharacterized protein (TIGR03067 family)